MKVLLKSSLQGGNQYFRCSIPTQYTHMAPMPFLTVQSLWPLTRAVFPASPEAGQDFLPPSHSAPVFLAHSRPPAMGSFLFEEPLWTPICSFTNTTLWLFGFGLPTLISGLKISTPALACLRHLPHKHTHTPTCIACSNKMMATTGCWKIHILNLDGNTVDRTLVT